MEAKIKPQDVTTKELRHGNLLMDLRAGIEIRVERILSNSIKASGVNNYSALFDYDMYEVAGIELSEDWLRRMGWIREEGGIYHGKAWNWFKIQMFPGGGGVLLIDGKQYTFLDYLHQFQNAWHSLTGSELTITDINNIEVK